MNKAEVRSLLREEYDNITYTAKSKSTEKLWLEVAEDLYRAQQRAKEAIQAERELKDRLKLLSNNETKGVGQFEFVKEERKGPVDYKAIPYLKDLDLEKYRGAPVDTWKLKVKPQLGER